VQSTMLSPAEFRKRFPILTDTVHLASCSLAPRSVALDTAMERMLTALAEDPTPWDFWLAEVEQSRQRFAALIGASPDEVAVVPSATTGAYQVAASFDWARRPRIVTTDLDYPSVNHIWLAQRPRGAEVAYVPERNGTVPAEDYLAELDERTALVSVPLVAYRTGARLPLAETAARAREVGARVFVDAYQAAGVVPIDVDELGCDYLISGTMKYLLGLPGIAYLYVRGGVTDDRAPELTGFFGRRNPIAFDPQLVDYPDGARRFQVNMPTFPAALAANAGLALIGELAGHAVHEHVDRLVARAIDRLTGSGVPLYSPTAPGLRGPYVAVLDGDPMGLARWLNERRVFPARGHVVRLSFHYFNDESDVDSACAAIADFRRRS
jgi:selenocysteine lyase/cysteine desulfurase